MKIEQLEAILAEVIDLLQEARMEARALRQMLVDHKVITEDELDHRIRDVTREELLDLKAEAYRRAFSRTLKDTPTQ